MATPAGGDGAAAAAAPSAAAPSANAAAAAQAQAGLDKLLTLYNEFMHKLLPFAEHGMSVKAQAEGELYDAQQGLVLQADTLLLQLNQAADVLRVAQAQQSAAAAPAGPAAAGAAASGAAAAASAAAEDWAVEARRLRQELHQRLQQ